MFKTGQLLRFVGPDVVEQPGGYEYDYSKNPDMVDRWSARFIYEEDYVGYQKPDGTPWYIYVSKKGDRRFIAYHTQVFAKIEPEDTFYQDGIE